MRGIYYNGGMNRKRKVKRWIIGGVVALVVILVGVLVWGLNGGFQGEQADEQVDERAANAPANDAKEDETKVTQSEQSTPAEPVSEFTQKAQGELAKMTLEEKVGQMFIARCPEADAANKAAQYHIGGYILFGRDFNGKTREQVVADIASYQNAMKVPLLIGVDEEGGLVNRVSSNPNLRAVPFWAPQDLYKEGGFALIESDTQEKDTLLHSLGINLNFAPVADVSTNPNDFIYARSFGQDAQQTAEFVKTVVSTMKNDKMGSMLKHFPGYGNNSDTHTGVAYDSRLYENFVNSDFVPFKAGIDAGANVVLVAHNVIENVDNTVPASLSAKIHEILRNDLGFTGVAITDDLIMDGVREFGTDEQTAVMAVQAGNDLLCSTNFETQIPAVVEAVQSGTITEERIDESVMRILEMKAELGIL